jgi:hypothetical protein
MAARYKRMVSEVIMVWLTVALVINAIVLIWFRWQHPEFAFLLRSRIPSERRVGLVGAILSLSFFALLGVVLFQQRLVLWGVIVTVVALPLLIAVLLRVKTR